MSAAAPQALATEPYTVTIPPDQAAQLETALTLCKALAAPGRLAILGVLAAPPFPTLSMAELAKRCALPAAALERDLRQLAEAGLIHGQYVKVLGQHRNIAREVGPGRRARAAAVQQHDRGAVAHARLVIVQLQIRPHLRVSGGGLEGDLRNRRHHTIPSVTGIPNACVPYIV